MADLSRKAIAQVQRFVRTLLKDEVPTPKYIPLPYKPYPALPESRRSRPS